MTEGMRIAESCHVMIFTTRKCKTGVARLYLEPHDKVRLTTAYERSHLSAEEEVTGFSVRSHILGSESHAISNRQ